MRKDDKKEYINIPDITDFESDELDVEQEAEEMHRLMEDWLDNFDNVIRKTETIEELIRDIYGDSDCSDVEIKEVKNSVEEIDFFYKRLKKIDITSEFAKVCQIELNEENEVIKECLRLVSEVGELTPAQQNDLLKRKLNGDESVVDELAELKLPLVTCFSYYYHNWKGVSFIDLEQEAVKELLEVVREYSDTGDCEHLDAYIAYRVNKHLSDIIKNDISINRRLSVSFLPTARKVREMQEKLKSELGYSPSLEELSEALNMSMKEINRIKIITRI